ncbi:MAG: hypothetical protein R2867_40960 [Caldilineaceae bacterium]
MTSTRRSQPSSIGAYIDKLLHKDSSLGYVLLGPGLLFLVVMMGYPFLYAVFLSFTDKQIGSVAHFTGLENYAKLMRTNLFASTVINSLVYTTFALIFKFCGGMALAVMLNRPFVGQRVIKAMLLLPGSCRPSSAP